MRKRIVLGGAVAAAALAFTTGGGTAWAGTNASVWTADAKSGGMATFTANGDELSICDMQADGYSAYGSVWDSITGVTYMSVTTTGGAGTCKSVSHDITEGRHVVLSISLVKDGKYTYGNSAEGVA